LNHHLESSSGIIILGRVLFLGEGEDVGAVVEDVRGNLRCLKQKGIRARSRSEGLGEFTDLPLFVEDRNVLCAVHQQPVKGQKVFGSTRIFGGEICSLPDDDIDQNLQTERCEKKEIDPHERIAE